MDPSRWQRLQQLFQDALGQPAAARAAFLDRACAGDEALRADVDRLLAHDARDDADVRHVIGSAAARLTSAHSAGRIGQQLGPWRLTAHLADGGMGAVYLAERADGQYAQQVAVKLLNPAFGSEAAKARLEGERQILARLAHPHIARLLDGGRSDDGVPYLVMEYVDGEPIDTWCEHQRLDTAGRLRLFVQVCRAVDHAHRNLVVHRDLKPSNILVDAGGVPRLLDFGIAKLLDDAPGLTRSGERVLTPSHASPEQVTGGAVTTATDVYALGVLLYDLLTGRPPYGGIDTPPSALARAIVETVPARPSSAVTGGSSRRLQAAHARGDRLTPERLARELAGDLDNIVLTALRKEPERRYASAAALADDIERFLADLPVHARPATLAYRGAMFVRRHRVAVPASALALLLAIGGAVLFTWRVTQERDRALAAEAVTRAAEARSRRSADFTAALLRSTRAEAGGAARVSVRELLDRAAARVDSELAGEPEVAARMRHALGSAYYSWQDFDAAHAQQQAALAQLQALHTGAHPDIAAVLSSLGNSAHALGRLEESLAWAQQAEAAWQAVGSAWRQAVARGDVGVALTSLRRLDEAQAVLQQALAALRALRPGDDAELAYYTQYLGYNRYRAGALDDALPYYEQALAMYRRLGTQLPALADLLQQLSALHGDRGDPEAAERSARELLPMLQALYGGDGGSTAMAMHNRLASVFAQRGRDDEALAHAETALAIALRLYGSEHRYVASCLQLRATLRLQQGRLDAAEADLREAERVRRAVLAADSPDFVGSEIAWARLALARGRTDEAERRLRQALAGPAPRQALRVDAEIALGTLLAGQGRRDEGLALARAGSERLHAGHWRRQGMAALLALPPFVDQATPAALAEGRRTADDLRRRLGPQAGLVGEIEQAIERALRHATGPS